MFSFGLMMTINKQLEHTNPGFSPKAWYLIALAFNCIVYTG